MVNLRTGTFARLIRILQIALLSAWFTTFAQAADDFSLNMFPSVGKPVYAVVEFTDFVPDPQEVVVASPDEYLNSGMERPQFLERTNIRKLSKNRFLLTSQEPIDTNNFVLLMDVTYDGARKFYPYEVTIGKNQAALSLGDVRENRAAEPPPTMPQPANRPAPIQQFPQTVPQTEQIVEIKTEPQKQRIVVTSEPLQTDATIKESSMYPTQPQVMYAQAPQLSGNTETLPFYMMAIVMTVLVLLAILAIGMFFHMNSNKEKSDSKKSDDENGVASLIKLLPTLLGIKEDLATANQNPMQNYGSRRRAMPAFYEDELSFNEPSNYSFQGDAQQFAQPRPTAQPAPAPAPQQSYVPSTAQPSSPAVRSIEPPKPRVPAPAPETKTAPAPAAPAPRAQTSAAPRVNAPQTPNRPAAPPAQTKPKVPVQPAPRQPVQAQPVQPPQNKPVQAPPQMPKPPQPPQQPTVQAAEPPQAPKEGPAVAKSEKLQLAVVYMNMGDDVMARMLLDELIREGSDIEKAEAQALMAKMGDSGPDVPFIADDTK